VTYNQDVEVEVLDHDNDDTGDGMTPSDGFLPIYNSAHQVL
jgi:hypothetical protein